MIVLVHGIASSTDNWDQAPTWSVARAFAAMGYVVIAYDRLGYKRSTFARQRHDARRPTPSATCCTR